MIRIPKSKLSDEFSELVRAIGEARSKQEEDRIITAEAITLKQRLQDPDMTSAKMKEYLLRSIYVEMLGHNAAFSYIYGVKLSQDKNLLCKRVGYLHCSLCLDPNHELLLLLVNTVQKDLNSSNYLEVAAALASLSKVLSQEMVPAVFPAVLDLLLHHSHELVRKRCCLALHAIYTLQPDLVASEARIGIRRALCDSDPSVIAGSLHLLYLLAKRNRELYVDLVPSVVCILKQIIEHRWPREFDYHGVPAPWIQVKLLALLATLGEGDKQATEDMQEVLLETIRRAELGGNAGFAITYEAVKTVTALYPSPKLLDSAATSISRFITAENHNLRYVGITGLASIVRVQPSFAARPDHQLVVLDCLEDADETLKRRTLDLLYRMTNPMNVTAIVEKLLLHLRLSVDTDFRRDLVSKVCRLADRFAPSHLWYITTLNEVLEMGGDLVPLEAAHNVLRLVAEGPTGDDAQDQKFRREAVNIYVGIAEKSGTLPDSLMRVAAWVLGEYGTLANVPGYENLDQLLELLCNALDKSGVLLTAIFKLSIVRFLALSQHCTSTAQAGCSEYKQCPAVWMRREARVAPCVLDVLHRYGRSASTDIEQRCAAFQALILSPEPGTPFEYEAVLREIYPFDGACEDIKVDATLCFLDGFVREALEAGAEAYQPPESRSRWIEAQDSGIDALPDAHGSLTSGVTRVFGGDVKKITANSHTGHLEPVAARTGLRFTPYDPPPQGTEIDTSRSRDDSQNRRTLRNGVGMTGTSQGRHVLHTCWDDGGPAEISKDGGAEAGKLSGRGSLFRVEGPKKWDRGGYKGFSSQARSSQKNDVGDNSTEGLDKLETSRTGIPYQSNTVSATHVRLQQNSSERERAAQALFQGLTPQTPPDRTLDDTSSTVAQTSRWRKGGTGVLASAVKVSDAAEKAAPKAEDRNDKLKKGNVPTIVGGGGPGMLTSRRAALDMSEDTGAVPVYTPASDTGDCLLDFEWSTSSTGAGIGQPPEDEGRLTSGDSTTNVSGPRESGVSAVVSFLGGRGSDFLPALSDTDASSASGVPEDSGGDFIGGKVEGKGAALKPTSRVLALGRVKGNYHHESRQTKTEEVSISENSAPATEELLEEVFAPSSGAEPQATGSSYPQLEPLKVSTDQVGQIWPALQAEKRAVLKTHASLISAEAVLQQLKNELQMAIVEVIGSEGIAAARLAGTTNFTNIEATAIFLHVRFTPPDQADVILRGNSSRVLEDILAQCRRVVATSPATKPLDEVGWL